MLFFATCESQMSQMSQIQMAMGCCCSLTVLMVIYQIQSTGYFQSPYRNMFRSIQTDMIGSDSLNNSQKGVPIIPFNGISVREDWYFTSAYLDHRQYPNVIITILAVRRSDTPTTYFKCRKVSALNEEWMIPVNTSAEERKHYDSGRARGITVTLKFKPFLLNKTFNLSTIFNADFLATLASNPVKSIQPKQFQLKLTYIPPLTQLSPKYNFSICIPATFGNISSKRFIEFIEMNRIFGADHFYLYDYTAGEINPMLKSVWNYYSRNDSQGKSIVSIMKWIHPPSYEDSDVYYHLQLLNIQHCLHRAMLESKYTIFHDLDELFVPVKTSSWSEFVQQIGFHGNDDRCSICFPMVYFRHEQSRNGNNKSHYFTDVLSTVHNRDIGKCITRTAYVYEMAVHGSGACIEGYKAAAMTGDIALIHHYYNHFCSVNSNQKHHHLCKLSNSDNSRVLKHESEFNRRVHLVVMELGLNLTKGS
jgi:hypothetical protein